MFWLALCTLRAGEKLSMNKGWSFRYIAPDNKELQSVLQNYFYKEAQSETIGWRSDELMYPSFDDSGWRIINIPHDFVIENVPSKEAIDTIYDGLPYKGFLERGLGIYRKLFDLSITDKGKRIWISFGGVFRDAQVFLNGFKLADHKSGYTPFQIDITDVSHYGTGKNVLIVMCDTRQSEGWWYEGGGIYRPVYLVKSGGSLYFEPDGITVNPVLQDDFSSSDIQVCCSVVNRERKNRSFRIESRITDKNGNKVNSASGTFDIDSWGSKEYRLAVNINNPKLWSPEEPNLYFLESDIIENSRVVESNRTRFGIRKIVFDSAKGLFLNGKHIKIKGASTHQDNGGVGIAVPEEIIRNRIQTMKKFGFNGYRSAHHAAAPALLDICDEEGMLVVNEQRIAETGQKYLEEMDEIIVSSRNHPSVFIYNLANEEKNLIKTDYEEGLASSLMQEIARLDPQRRPATMNRVFWIPGEKSEEPGITLEEYLVRAYTGASNVLDVAGFSYSENIMYGYSRPGQPVIQTESKGNMCTRGIYETNKDKLWVSSLPDWKMHERIRNFMTTDRISATFVWTAFDYRGEPVPFSFFPGVSSQFGLFDLCGFPKDPAYFYKAVQSPEPVLHLFPHWTWRGREGEKIKVFTYTNLEEVELFQDGRGLGRQKVSPYENQSWDVEYRPGTLIARGYRAGKIVMTDKVVTSGNPYSVRVSASRDTLKADGEDAVTLKFEILDKKGTICPWADNIINIRIKGKGHLLGVDNGNPANMNPAKIPVVRAFSGLCSAVIQSEEETGKIVVTAASEGLLSGVLEIWAIPSEITPEVKSEIVVKEFMFFRRPTGWIFN